MNSLVPFVALGFGDARWATPNGAALLAPAAPNGGS